MLFFGVFSESSLFVSLLVFGVEVVVFTGVVVAVRGLHDLTDVEVAEVDLELDAGAIVDVPLRRFERAPVGAVRRRDIDQAGITRDRDPGASSQRGQPHRSAFGESRGSRRPGRECQTHPALQRRICREREPANPVIVAVRNKSSRIASANKG